MSHYVIGDVQGCYVELMALLEKISFNSELDYLWLCGDVINAGPNNLEVLRFLSHLPSERVMVTLGNHDLHALAVYYGVREYRDKDTFRDILKAPDAKVLMAWLSAQSLMHYDAHFQCVLMHAGVHPDWSLEFALMRARDLETQLKAVPQRFLQAVFGRIQTLEAQALRQDIDILTRMRFLDIHNHLDLAYKGTIEKAPKELMPWFCKDSFRNNTPIWKNTDVLFGHWAALEGKSSVPHIYPLDTGCVWGQQLTAFCLETREYYRVPGQKYRKN